MSINDPRCQFLTKEICFHPVSNTGVQYYRCILLADLRVEVCKFQKKDEDIHRDSKL